MSDDIDVQLAEAEDMLDDAELCLSWKDFKNFLTELQTTVKSRLEMHLERGEEDDT